MRDVGYDQIFCFKYSERPGAPAAKLADDVPLEVKKRRLAELLATQEEVWRRHVAAATGEIWTVVVEAPARRPEGAQRARTANNRKVLLRDGAYGIGDLVRVRITGCEATTFAAVPVN